MKHLTPQIIADVTGGEYVGSEQARNVSVHGTVRDNRGVESGNLFLCIRGARVDGHTFANDAFERGAACALAEQAIPDANGPYVIVESTLEAVKTLGAYYRELFNIPVIGITGSVGKTTAKEMVAAVLGEKFNVLKTPENLNNELGVPLTLLSLDTAHEAAVIEMGISDFGEMSRLAMMVRPDIFIMTKIGYAHLDNLGDLDGVLKAKTEAFAYMNPATGIGVLNGDDDRLWNFDPGMRKITFGLGKRNDYRAENVYTEDKGVIKCDIVHDKSRYHVTIPAFGEHLAHTALSAAVVGDLLGMTSDEIARGLRSYAPVGSRANVTDTGFVTVIADCYNANPSSVKPALEALSKLSGRRVAILGDMMELGDQADELHRETGAFAQDCGLDLLICCGDKAKLLYEGYVSSGGNAARYYPNKQELIGALPDLIEKGDTVLVKASNSMRFEEVVAYFTGE